MIKLLAPSVITVSHRLLWPMAATRTANCNILLTANLLVTLGVTPIQSRNVSELNIGNEIQGYPKKKKKKKARK
jgi:hypothetical protein